MPMPKTLTRWDPFADLGELRFGIDRMLTDWLETGGRSRMPHIDVVRGEHALLIRADMPGIKPEEVKIEIQGDLLTVTGEHTEEREEDGADYIRRERHWGAFRRSVGLPTGVDARAITATAHDGVVEVTVPMAKPEISERVTISPTPA